MVCTVCKLLMEIHISGIFVVSAALAKAHHLFFY